MNPETNSKIQYPSKQRLIDLFDYVDGNLIWKHRCDMSDYWNRRYSEKKAGYLRITKDESVEVSLSLKIDGKNYQVSRIVWIYHNGDIPKGNSITFKDHDCTNTKIENLTCETVNGSKENQKPNHGRRSGVKYKGVYLKKWTGFKAEISINKKLSYIGFFKTDIEAAEAYNKKAIEQWGCDAVLNDLSEKPMTANEYKALLGVF